MKLTELIAEIKIRPRMYLGTKSIKGLRCFLLGYMYGLGDKDNFEKDYSEFCKWITLKFDINSSRGWVEIILYHKAVNDYEALAEFFKLFDEFVQLHHIDASS